MDEAKATALYESIKYSKIKFDEAKHCSLILRVMADPDKGTYSSFCVKAEIGERKFYDWLKKSEVFQECYALGRMFARENWERLGQEIREEVLMPGTASNRMSWWQQTGWSRFGIGKNSRIRLDLDPKGTPNEHYSQLLYQASQGDFTAGEIKQLMEAVNVGLSAHQVFMMQQEIDQLRADLATMVENSNGHNTFSDKGLTQADKDPVADSVR